MPRIRPFHKLILIIFIQFMGFTDKLVVVPFDLLQGIIGKLATLLFSVPL